MPDVLVVESSERDADRWRQLLQVHGCDTRICVSGHEASAVCARRDRPFSVAIVLWDIPGPPFGPELLADCRRRWPEMPVVVVSATLDATLAARAYVLGARDFLEKPLDSERVRACLRRLIAADDEKGPVVVELQHSIVGDSPALRATLTAVARVVPHSQIRVLLIGESGTGKELLAAAIHRLGPSPEEPFVAVNLAETPATLVESALFGHERGAFTGAGERHIGFLEESRGGTLFLDEIGELEMPLQSRLLRVIQARQFRRLKGHHLVPFRARLVCATNKDLAAAVMQGTFRRDLFHRVAEATVHVPPLRERSGDVDLLVKHFLEAHADGSRRRLARETAAILHSYPFPGNVRELENIIRTAVVQSTDCILPEHLPLRHMATFLAIPSDRESSPLLNTGDGPTPSPEFYDLYQELATGLPVDWLLQPYRQVMEAHARALDRVFLPRLLERCRHNVTAAAARAGVDTKTFRKRWSACGLPPLTRHDGDADA